MMSFALKTAAICTGLFAAALPATAQDADAIAAAAALFDPAGSTGNDVEMVDAAAALLNGIDGRWFEVPPAIALDLASIDVGTLRDRGCDPDRALAVMIDRASPFSFDMARSRTRDGETTQFAVRYENLARNAYQPSFDVMHQTAFLGMTEPAMAASVILSPTLRQPVAVYRPDPGLLVLAALGFAPQIYVRCP